LQLYSCARYRKRGLPARNVPVRIGWIADLVIPVFTATMALIDTTDGVLCGWAFIKPVRKLRQNAPAIAILIDSGSTGCST
jgi:high-affinity nickel permease